MENRPAIRGILLVAVAALLLVGAIVLAVFRHGVPLSWEDRIARMALGRNISVEMPVPVVVEKIQALDRLESVHYSLDTVVEGSSSNPILPDMLFGDKMLMIVHGQAVAGVDLSKLTPQSVVITPLAGGGRSIRMTLPAPEIFSATLDNTHTRVYSRTTGWLASPDKDLETTTRQHAEQQLRQAALDDGILDAAHKNACASITLLLSGLGFQQVSVQ